MVVRFFFAVYNHDYVAYNGLDSKILDLEAGATAARNKPAAAYNPPAAKGGKQRMYQRVQKLDEAKFSALYKRTPYVRFPGKKRVKRCHQKWSISFE